MGTIVLILGVIGILVLVFGLLPGIRVPGGVYPGLTIVAGAVVLYVVLALVGGAGPVAVPD